MSILSNLKVIFPIGVPISETEACSSLQLSSAMYCSMARFTQLVIIARMVRPIDILAEML